MSDSPPSGFLLDTPAERKIREDAARKREKQRSRRLQVRYNGILMGATILTAGVLIYQSWVLNETLVEMGKQSVAAQDAVRVGRLQLDAAERQLVEARDANQKSQRSVADSLGLTREQMRAAERAWITVSAARLLSVPATGEHPVVRIEFQNTGHTPGIHVANFYLATIGNALGGSVEFPKNVLRESVAKAGLPISNDVVGPNALKFIEVRTAQFPKETALPLIADGRLNVILLGFMEYEDIYSVKHTTIYCLETFAGGGISLTACQKWNSAD